MDSDENYPLADPYGWITVSASSCKDNGNGYCTSCSTVHQMPKDNLTAFAARESAAIRVEPEPIKNDNPHAWDLVIADMIARDKLGATKYNTHLQPHNGRDQLTDLYQELLDACVYLRNALYERDGK